MLLLLFLSGSGLGLAQVILQDRHLPHHLLHLMLQLIVLYLKFLHIDVRILGRHLFFVVWREQLGQLVVLGTCAAPHASR